jgi:WD40 repeat protein
MTEEPSDDGSGEQRLHEVLGAYFEAAERGEEPDRHVLLDRHPDLAAQIADFFAVEDHVHHLAAPARALEADGSLAGNGKTMSEPTLELNARTAFDRRTSAAMDSIVFGDYDLLGLIARGGMGVVFRARHRSLNRLVALKLVRGGADATAHDARRFRNEAEAVAHLDHPNIVPIYEVGEEHGCSFFSMKLVDGGNLSDRLREFHDDPRAGARLMADVAQAVHHAHERGILHRDLKPSNILIDDRGAPLVADFGLARRVDEESELTLTGAVLGTPSYMAPEQATGQGLVTKAADIHGLGAVLYAILTGLPPFKGVTPLETLRQVKEKTPEIPRAIRQSIDRDLETICLKCLEKEPERRYPSALAVAEDLERWRTGRSIMARPVSRPQHAWRWCRRNRRITALAAAIAVLILTVTLGLFARTRAGRDAARLESILLDQQYATAVKHAEQLWADNRPVEALAMLEQLRPAPGNADRRGFAWHYLHRLCHIGLPALQAHEGEVYSAAFSPDGKTLATAGHDKTVCLWEPKTGKLRIRLVGHRDEINSVSFSPDGRSLVTASDDETVRIWDAGSGRYKATLTGHNDRVVAASFTPDGRRVVSCARKGRIVVWDPVTSILIGSFSISNGTLQSMAISPDGQTLAVTGEQVAIWSLKDACELTRLDADNGQINCAVFSCDGEMMATAGKNGKVKLWETDHWRHKTTFVGHQGVIESVTFAPDGRTVAAVCGEGFVYLWDTAASRKDLIATGQGRLWGVAFSPDGRTLATTSKDSSVKLWDMHRDRARIVIEAPTYLATSLALARVGKSLLVVDAAGKLQNFDTTHGQLFESTQLQADRSIENALLSNDSAYVVTAEENGVITLWDALSRRRVLQINSTIPHVQIGAISAGAQRVSIQKPLNQLVVWDPTRASQISFNGLGATQLAFSPRKAEFSSWGWGTVVPKIWDIASQIPRPGKGAGHRNSINAETFSCDGAILATGDVDGSIIVWDTTSMEQLFPLYGHAGRVEALAFSPDGRTLVSGGEDRIVRLWDLRARTLLLRLEGHASVIRHIVFSADGSVMATGGDRPGGGSELILWRARAADSAPIRP